MDDGGDRVEEGESALAGLGGDRLGKLRAREGAGGDDRRVIRHGVDPLAHDFDLRMRRDGGSDLRREPIPVHGERGSGGNPVLVGRSHDERAKRPHLLVEQADGVVLGVVRPEAVRADHLRQPIGLVRRRRIAAAAHLA